MMILGLNHGEINASAAIVRDGRLVAGSPEERFSREKLTKAFPRQAIQYCLGAVGATLPECDAVAQAWNPGAHWIKYNGLMSATRIRREDYFYTVPDNLLNLTERKPPDWVEMNYSGESGLPPTFYIQHHRCHAANAFFLSPFDEAAILTCDWRGEFESTTMGVGRGTDIEIFHHEDIPNSIGMFYATYTELLGYRPDNDEWKVMALSSFDVDCSREIETIRGTLRLLDGGRLELDQSYYKGAAVDQPYTYTRKLVNVLGGRVGRAGEDPDEWHYRIARAMQTVAVEIAVHFLNHLWQRTGCPNLVLGGGFFMNSVFNGRALELTPFENLYVSYAPGDDGNSIGAALYVAHCLKREPRSSEFNSSTIGPSFTDHAIEEALIRRRIAHRRSPSIVDEIADLLAAGRIVATFNGPMEFGARALGNRSILAPPRPAEVKDRINAAIKYREPYRPFAPAVQWEHAHVYFDTEQGFDCPYMEKVVPVTAQYREALAAVTHVDGSGRVQTVKQEHNPFFHAVIGAFGDRTGVPCVLNTSFNINGEPIVLSPDDALSTFYNSGLEHLALGDFVVSKGS